MRGFWSSRHGSKSLLSVTTWPANPCCRSSETAVALTGAAVSTFLLLSSDRNRRPSLLRRVTKKLLLSAKPKLLLGVLNNGIDGAAVEIVVRLKPEQEAKEIDWPKPKRAYVFL